MLITKIEKQKKSRGRCNLYVDEEFFCGLYGDTILKYGITAGDEISQTLMDDIKQFDEYLYGKKIAMDYLSYRIRTETEIKRKLRLKKISDTSIEKVISHLKDLKLLNDEEFALQLVSEKIKNKPIGKKLLLQKLYEKGIPKSISESTVDKLLEPESEKLLAGKIFFKLKPKLRGLNNIESKKKIYDTLSRKGFSPDIINEIIREKTNNNC